MKNFNRKNTSRGKDKRGDRQMHQATCADCGRDCEVPFKPSGDKPVYCSNCFKGDRKPKDEGRGRNRRRGDNREDRQMHKATCADCGKNCEVPFRPSGGKPVYCSNCFSKGDGSGSGQGSGRRKSDQSNKKHDEINAKLDKILFLLQRTDSAKEVEVKEPKKQPKKEKEASKKAVKKADAKKVAPKKAVKKAVAKKTVKKVAKKAPAKKKK